LHRLKAELSGCLQLLAISGSLPKVLGTWVRLELLEEIGQEVPTNQEVQDEEKRIPKLIEATQDGSDSEALRLPDYLLKQKPLIRPACLRWARAQWGHRLRSVYLERKGDLDQASCRMFRVGDKHLCVELYHRIKAGETSFEEVARVYGQGPEREQNGLIALQPLSRLPMGLGKVVRRLEEGRLMPPQRLGESFAVVQLERYIPSQLDESTEERLLTSELGNWIAAVVGHLLDHLGSEQDSSGKTP
jgi:parvulin-like peptidyl-prolyl isomerase